MPKGSSRRTFLFTSTAVAVTGVAGGLRATASPADPPSPTPTPSLVPASWPTQPAEIAREMVGVSHANLERVSELLSRWPTLANAAWDWGFGDWETALGAASHVGNRPIAELLLQNGARPTIFSAAMLGQLEVVKAFVATNPGQPAGVQKTRGPHGITLLAHARAGGEAAAAVVAYLTALGDADPQWDLQPLSEAEALALQGTYLFGSAESERITIGANRVGLFFQRQGSSPRNLLHVGDRAFFPVGAPRVRIRFEFDAAGKPTGLHVDDPDRVLTARRI